MRRFRLYSSRPRLCRHSGIRVRRITNQRFPDPPGIRPRGFTLVEVVIALAIVAMALGATISTASHYASNSHSLQERTMAHWVAWNVLMEMENSDPWPATGERQGNMEMGNHRWRWEATIQGTPDPSLRRVDIDVAHADNPGRVINRASGFLGERPTRPGGDDEGPEMMP